MTEKFIETCADEYFNGYAKSGVPNYLKYTFGEFVELRKVDRYVR